MKLHLHILALVLMVTAVSPVTSKDMIGDKHNDTDHQTTTSITDAGDHGAALLPDTQKTRDELPPSFPVAFTVRLTSGDICEVEEDMTVPFNDVVLNYGGAFNGTSYHFVVPVAGIYSVSVTGVSCQDGKLLLNLMNNGVKIHRTYHSAITDWAFASINLMLYLEKLDELWVEIEVGHTLHGHPDWIYNSFCASLYADF